MKFFITDSGVQFYLSSNNLPAPGYLSVRIANHPQLTESFVIHGRPHPGSWSYSLASYNLTPFQTAIANSVCSYLSGTDFNRLR